MSFPVFHIPLDRSKPVSLHRQVYEKIRDDILLKKLVPGSRLPATRTLAKDLNVSRNVILEAYDQLHAEGYVQSKSGSYTRVCSNTHYAQYQKPAPVSVLKSSPKKRVDITFKTGLPDLTLFPRSQWARCLKEAVKLADTDELAYYRPEGHYGFRQVLADYLYRTRGIEVAPDQIVVTSGATQALYLAARILFHPGCRAVLEDPGGYGIIRILKTAGYQLKPMGYKEEGSFVTRKDIENNTRLICVTPSHQFPMGRIMPASDRIALLNAVDKKEVFIIEDDYDSEFRYDGPPLHPLKALNPDKVIYLGSFSKNLSPGLRIGYAVVPANLLKQFKKQKQFSDAQSPIIDQIALKLFIEDGGFERHIFRMKKEYRKKRDTLVSQLLNLFGSRIKIFGENAGLHLVVQFKNIEFDIDEQENVIHNQVQVQSVEKHAIVKGHHKDKLLFGYGHLTRDEIIQGVKRLKNLI